MGEPTRKPLTGTIPLVFDAVHTRFREKGGRVKQSGNPRDAG